MELLLDGESGFTLAGDVQDVFAAVACVCDYLRERGRGIMSVDLDGKAILPTDLAGELKGVSPDDVTRLSIESADLKTLALGVLDSFNDLPELASACRQLAQVFQGDSPEQGYEPFQRLAEIWSQIKEREALVVHALELEEDACMVRGKAVGALHEELNRYLQEAISALETGDCVLLGDLLEHELAPRAELEADIVAALQEKARERSG